jgi:hypothetical protein
MEFFKNINMKKISYILFFVLLAIVSCSEDELVKSDYDYVSDPNAVPSGVTTGDVIDNLGTGAVITLSVNSDGGSKLLDNGIMLSITNDFSIEKTGNTVFGSATNPSTGNFEIRINNLSKNTTYYYRAYALNANGAAYGEVKSFTTANVTFTPYQTAFDPSQPADITDWIFDRYTGFDPDGVDLVWFSTDIGSTSVACYWDGEDLTLVSPLLRIANAADVLSFQFYSGGYGSPETKVKVFIAENLDNLGTPVKDWTLGSGAARTSIPMESYFEKSVYIVIRIESGDFILYNFAVKPD